MDLCPPNYRARTGASGVGRPCSSSWGPALLANATVVHALDVGGARYEYRAGPLDTGEGALSTEIVPDHFDDVDCLRGGENERLCAIEAWLLEERGGNGTATVHLYGTPGTNEKEYAYLGDFYRRIYRSDVDDGTTVTIGPERVTRATAFDDLAVDRDSLSDPARRALEDGAVVAQFERDEGKIVETDEGFVAIAVRQTAWPDPLLQAGSFLVQFGLGLGLVGVGWSRVRSVPE
ncbi:hypothetical protein [Halobellus sp. EA9]|uniref:hypothetical protein n=1 Tax=Halobellus sp. EA9 TaxID=3421647 RepID=UPI003EB86F9C